MHARAVAVAVEQGSGGRAVILDTAAYPTQWTLTMHAGPRDLGWTIAGPTWSVTGADVSGIWWRRPRDHEVAPEIRDERARDFARAEARAGLRGWLESLGDRVINPVAAEVAASWKPYQLRVAEAVGLNVPPTLITNSPQEAERFVRDHNDVVFKVLTGTSWRFTETRRFEAEHNAVIGTVHDAPVIFQRVVPAVCDVRVTIVDADVFPVAIRTGRSEAALDWRLDLACTLVRHDLPRQVTEKLRELLRRLRLRYGAIDMRLTPSGEYVFLEVNPSGQFLFCEIHAGQPISHALARGLLRRSHGSASMSPPSRRADRTHRCGS